MEPTAPNSHAVSGPVNPQHTTSPHERLTRYQPRPKGLIPLRDGRVDLSADLSALAAVLGDHPLPPVMENASDPWQGITHDGNTIPDLYRLQDHDVDCRPAVDAASSFIGELPTEVRRRAVHPIDSSAWRMWTNAFPSWEPHGACLQHVGEAARGAAMRLVSTSLSDAGYEAVRDVMRLNKTLGELVGDYPDTLTEWMYFLAIFGDPSPTKPWGWQLSGHHLDVNCVFIGRQMVLTPTFMGAEPWFADSGTYQGTEVLAAERAAGFTFFSSLSAKQRNTATLFPSMLASDLPHELSGLIEGRHLAGAGHDNRQIPYAGVPARDLSPAQVHGLKKVAAPYLGRLPAGARQATSTEVERSLPDTWFAWIGGDDPNGPYYYRLHSPVILIEFDNHGGIFFDNDEAEPFHTHTIVRTPNGNDYGKDLLRQHYQHHHRPRTRALD